MATYKAAISVVAYLYLVASNLAAQLKVLTTREAERILDLVPAIEESKTRGRCPSYYVNDDTAIELSIQVRESCPPAGFASNLLDNYVVNRQTGAVAEGLDPDSLVLPITTPEINSLASGLLRRARARVLNGKEAECLILEAARSQLDPTEPNGALSASRVSEARGEWRFSVAHRIPNRAAVATKFFTICPDTAGVRDDRESSEFARIGPADFENLVRPGVVRFVGR